MPAKLKTVTHATTGKTKKTFDCFAGTEAQCWNSKRTAIIL